MTRIDSSAMLQLMTRMRQQMAGVHAPTATTRSSRAGGAGTPGQTQARRSGQADRPSDADADAAHRLTLALRQIDPDDPHRAHKVFRVFLESVFRAEFGAALTQDARFDTLVDAVQRQMAQDPELAAQMQQAVTVLTRATPTP